MDAIKNYDLKNKVLYLSTGYSNNIDDSQKNFIQKQFALIKQYGIKAKVFGVSLNYADNKGEARNNYLAALCKSAGADFLGGFKGTASDNFIHPKYYKI